MGDFGGMSIESIIITTSYHSSGVHAGKGRTIIATGNDNDSGEALFGLVDHGPQKHLHFGSVESFSNSAHPPNTTPPTISFLHLRKGYHSLLCQS